MLANLLTFFVLVVPLPDAARWARNSAVIALPIAGAQVLVEGFRWQMIPAYLLTIILFSIWLVGVVMPGGLHVNRLVVGLGIGLGVLGLAVSTVLPIIFPIFHFPQPSGPYEIGTLTYHWVDNARSEMFSADPNDRRELIVQIWYPAKGTPSSPRAPYVSDPRVFAGLLRMLHLPEFLFDQFIYVRPTPSLPRPWRPASPPIPC